jgi:hypothetical protein
MSPKKSIAVRFLVGWSILLIILGVGLQIGSAHPRPATLAQHPPSMVSVPAPDEDIELIGHIGGTASVMDVNEKYIAAAYTGGFDLIDIANPAQLREVGFLTSLPYSVHDIALDGDFAYVTYGSSDGFGINVGGLYIVDISDPTAPVLVKDIHTDAIYARVAINGHYAYVTSGGLTVFDVSNPSAPVEVGHLSDVSFDFGFEILQGMSPGNPVYAFAGSGSGLMILDLTDATQPEVIGTHPTSSTYISDIAVHTQYYNQTGNIYLYLAESAYYYDTAGIELVDVTNPSSPVSIMTYDPDTSYGDIEIDGTYAYATSLQEFKQGPHILDISDPVAPQEIFTYTPTQNVTDLAVLGKYLYVSDFVSGLHILDISEPSNPITIAAKEIMGNIALITGNYAYGTVSPYLDSGLQVWDLLNPVAPIQVGLFPLSNQYSAAVASGNYALFAEYEGDVRLFDISDPTLPVSISILEINSFNAFGPSAIAVKGEIAASDENAYAYITSWEGVCWFPDDCHGVIHIYDISEPLTPTWSGHYGIQGVPIAISVSDPYAFIALDEQYTNSSYLAVLDVSAVQPTLVTTVTMDSRVWDMTIFNDHAYLALTDSLSIIDISDPASSIEVGRYEYRSGFPISGHLSSVIVREGYAYLSESMNSLLIVLDISDPTDPVEIERVQMPGGGGDLTISGDVIYASNGEGGVSIYQHAPDTGRVEDVNGRPFSGVTVELDDQAAAASGLTGSYDVSDAPVGTHTLSPDLQGFAFWPPDRTVELTEYTQRQDFTALPQPVSITLSASLTTTLRYTDTSYLPTQLDFPPVPLPGTLTLVLTPTLSAGFADKIPTGHSFELRIYQDGSPLPGFSFASPVQATIQYSRLNVRFVGEDNLLGLYSWDGDAWIDGTLTCEPQAGISHDLENRRVQVSFCQTGDYALFGPTNLKFLSLINR